MSSVPSSEKCGSYSSSSTDMKEKYVLDIERYFSNDLVFGVSKDDEGKDERNTHELLEKANSSIDSFYRKENTREEFKKVMSLFDPYRSIKYVISRDFRAQAVTNSWTKMWEILSYFDLVPQSMRNESYITFETSDVLGGSFQALHHYVKTNTFIKSHVWSLNAPESSRDVFGFQQHYESRTSRCGLENVREALLQQGLDKVHLFVADRGVENSDYNKLEEVHFPQLLKEVELAFLCLEKGGSAIFKAYTMFKDETIGVVSSLCEMFEKVFVYKPRTSKITMSECYLVGINYKGKIGDDNLTAKVSIPASVVLGGIQADSINRARCLYEEISNEGKGGDEKFWKGLRSVYKPKIAKLQTEWFRKFPIKSLRPKDKLKIKDLLADSFTK